MGLKRLAKPEQGAVGGEVRTVGGMRLVNSAVVSPGPPVVKGLWGSETQ